MAVCQLHYFSPALGKQQAAQVILPEGKPGPFPVYYLLHGLSDDHTIWTRRTSIERYVQDLPLMVVMPDGGRGFYTDAKEGPKYESAITKDLIPYVDRVFKTRAERAGRCIGGLSMGGYGAVKLGLKHADLFISANSHSGALAWAHKPIDANNPLGAEWRRILGNDHVGGQDDCFALASKMHTPFLRIDCGTEDFLLNDNREFHAHLEKLGMMHEYQEFPGSHNWAYWDQHVQEAIAFHKRHLGI